MPTVTVGVRLDVDRRLLLLLRKCFQSLDIVMAQQTTSELYRSVRSVSLMRLLVGP